MGKTILTPSQSDALELATQEKEIYKTFFLTGGTALSEFYLHHRYSEDLDFFSEEDFNPDISEKFVTKLQKKFNAKLERRTRTGFYRYELTGDFGILKMDFVYHIFKQLEYGKNNNNLRIASLWDIVVDKLYTIFHRGNARDFVDLYFGIREVGCDFDQLFTALDEKYESTFNRMSLISRLPIVQELTDYPKMLVPFDKKEMEDYFLKVTKSLEGEILK